MKIVPLDDLKSFIASTANYMFHKHAIINK